MGVRRYSRNPIQRRREQALDHLQWRCGLTFVGQYEKPPTIGELLDAGVLTAVWTCRNTAGGCWRHSEPFSLSRFGRDAWVHKLRKHFVCSECGTGYPRLRLELRGIAPATGP